MTTPGAAPALPKYVRDILGPQPHGPVIEASLFTRICTHKSMRTEQALVDLLPAAAVLACPVVSGYRVGAVALGVSGAVYLGANLEVPGAPLACAMHAEQAAIALALSHQEQGILALAVSSWPCGLCRQFLMELAAPRSLVIALPFGSDMLGDLLPSAFEASTLNRGGNLLQHSYQDLDVTSGADPVIEAAVRAARISYAPYTGSLSGVALQTLNGRILTGSCIESVAFNPTISPLNAALSALALNRIALEEVRRAVLVEREDCTISQAPLSQLLLSCCSSVNLEVVAATIPSQPNTAN